METLPTTIVKMASSKQISEAEIQDLLLESEESDGSDLDEDESGDDAVQSDNDIESESDGDNVISVES